MKLIVSIIVFVAVSLNLGAQKPILEELLPTTESYNKPHQKISPPKIYPVVSTYEIHIESASPVDSIKLYNNYGKLIKTWIHSSSSIFISEIPEGEYIIQTFILDTFYTQNIQKVMY